MKKFNLKHFLENSIHVIYLLVFCICAFFTLFHFKKYPLGFPHSTPKTILFACLAALILFLWEYLLKGKNNKFCNIVRACTTITLVLLQIFLFLKTITPIGWDVLEVVNAAEFGLYNGDYFVKHPNNLFLEIFLSKVLHLTSFITFLSSQRKLEILNLFFVDAAILMAVLTTNKLYGLKAADRVFMTSMLLIGFHPTLSVIYSDTLAMPFPIGTLCCLTFGLKSNSPLKRTLFFSLGAVFGIVGFFIKPTVVIVDIAIIIIMLLHWKKDFLKSGILLSVFIAILAGFITYAAINVFEASTKAELTAQYPDIKPRSWLHYLSLGLSKPTSDSSGYGSWNEKEVTWMQEHIDHPNYVQETVEHIKERLIDFGPPGYAEFLMDKLIWAGSDGTFFYGGEGDFHLEEQESTDTLRGKLQTALYIETDFYQNRLSSWLQGVWLMICIRSILCYFEQERSAFSSIAKLSVLGLFLFLLLFENRSRYLFLYLPVFIFALESSHAPIKKLLH